MNSVFASAKNPMVLFFPQYQAGIMPSRIPVGTPSLRELWKGTPGFVEVPLQPTDPADPQEEGGIRFRRILKKQAQDAVALIDRAKPDFILTTGGDCGASFASIDYMNTLYEGKLGVIWVDAHADIHTAQTSPSGNYHGMVLRNLMEAEGFDLTPRRALGARQIAYLGLRDTESEEDAAIAANAIPRFDAKSLREDNDPLHKVLAHFRDNGVTHLHLHVDCDVLDAAIFPHVHVPEPDGLTLERLLEILQYLRTQMPMASCCLTEYAPATSGAGLDIVKKIYREGLGLPLI